MKKFFDDLMAWAQPVLGKYPELRLAIVSLGIVLLAIWFIKAFILG